MAPDSFFTDKTSELPDRDRLILALKQLQEAYDRQAEVIERYERLYRNRKKPGTDVLEELETRRELNRSLAKKLREKQEDFEVQKEEPRLFLEQQSGIEASSGRSEQDFRTIVETSGEGIVIARPDGHCLYVNQRMADMLGYPIDEILGKTSVDFTSLDVAPQMFHARGDLNKGNRVQCEIKFRRKDGSALWTVSNATPMYNEKGEHVATLAMHSDITERKRVEVERERLLKDMDNESRRLRAVIDSMPLGVAIHDVSGRALEMNEMVGRIWHGDAPLPASISDFGKYKAWFAESGDPVRAEDWTLARAIEKREAIVGDVFHIRRFDGTRGTIMNSAAPIKDSEGQISGWVVVAQDISRQKQLEQQLIESKQQAELYLDLMGHDINNLHQIALGYLELARDMPHGEDQALLLDKPVEVLQRSALLINNVRKLQKLHEGVFQTLDVDVCQVLSDVVREFEAIPNKKVELNLNGRDHCYVHANELLHDVVANLVNNAIKHTGERANVMVYLDVVEYSGAKYCRVMVEDDGPGIPNSFKAAVFNRTLKGTNKARGMGLGLYLVKSLVDSYGGRVWVEDRIMGDHMKGSRFVVILPTVEK